ncbi:bifunctional phosphoribosylaminoimidazolecarboxamide formyltransferase/IMP cyclohydrolase [Bdellovibrionota bacterium FG-1]
MSKVNSRLKIRRALLTVSDKAQVVALARALVASGAELVATGRTALVLKEAGLQVMPIEQLSGSPEAFQGRMKTLSSPVCSGILYRRGDASDEADLKRLNIQGIDCVVVNFYPFEKTAEQPGILAQQLVEEIDIGGPTLVRAAAKNSPDVLVLTDPAQYASVIGELAEKGTVAHSTVSACASQAWDRVLDYDRAIASRLGSYQTLALRYGENPHQKGVLEFDPHGPLDWGAQITRTELSYNNILDLSAAYGLASDLREIEKHATGVVIVKHNNPCGVALMPQGPQAQKAALIRAWEGDPVSAFGGVLVFTDPLEDETALWLSEKFVELVAAPGLSAETSGLKMILNKRKNLKAVPILRFGDLPAQTAVSVPGGILKQSADVGLGENLRSVTTQEFSEQREGLGRFGIAVCRALKSNAIAIVRQLEGQSSFQGYQLIGAGQGQPNRVEALKHLAIPRAENVLNHAGGHIEDAVMVSDAFFPFRDTVDAAFEAGLMTIIQPGGSIKDQESIDACNEHGMVMAFTGVRHFRH